MEKSKQKKIKSLEINTPLINESKWLNIDPKMPMAELVETYPEIIEPLTYDYGLHCVSCIISDFDTLEEGAIIHGIEGEDLIDMIKDLEKIINGIDRE